MEIINIHSINNISNLWTKLHFNVTYLNKYLLFMNNVSEDKMQEINNIIFVPTAVKKKIAEQKKNK